MHQKQRCFHRDLPFSPQIRQQQCPMQDYPCTLLTGEAQGGQHSTCQILLHLTPWIWGRLVRYFREAG